MFLINKNIWPGPNSTSWISENYVPDLVSVIIPTYNRVKCLMDALDSVLAQLYRPIEVVIVDDGSTDETEKAVQNWYRNVQTCRNPYHEKHHFEDEPKFVVRYVYQNNAGGQAARNNGLKRCRGEFIQMLDSDDLLARDKIALQVELLKNQGTGNVVYGPVRYFEPMDNGYAVYPSFFAPCGEQQLKHWIGGWFVPPHSFLWKRIDVLRLGPWDISLTADQDGEYAMRFLAAGGKFIFCDNAWSYYRQCPNSTRYSTQTSRQENERAIRSRIRVTRRLELFLSSHGLLDLEYRRVISHRYYLIVKNASMANLSLRRYCIRHFKRLSPDGSAPGSRLHNSIVKLLGPQLTLHLRKLFWYRLAILKHRPIRLVKTEKQICAIDERGTLDAPLPSS